MEKCLEIFRRLFYNSIIIIFEGGIIVEFFPQNALLIMHQNELVFGSLADALIIVLAVPLNSY